MKSALASRKVLWFLFLFNAAAASFSLYLAGTDGIGAAVGLGLASLGAGVGLRKHPGTRSVPEARDRRRDASDPAAVRTPSPSNADVTTVPSTSDGLENALRDLIPQKRTGEMRTDLVAAAAEAWRRRHANTIAGATVVSALARGGLSYQQISELTGIPPMTAHRWKLIATREW